MSEPKSLAEYLWASGILAEKSPQGVLSQTPPPHQPTGLLGALYSNPLMQRQIAAQRAAYPRQQLETTQQALDFGAGILGMVPGIGDAMGFAADINRYRTEPESRTLPNFGLTGLGLLPFMPGMTGMTKTPKTYDAYHGTKSEVQSFDLRRSGKSDPGLFGGAVYLTPSPEQASSFATSPHYGKGNAPNVMPLRVTLSNPLVVKDGVLPDGRRLSELHPNGITEESATAAKKWAIERGHDGVVFETGGEVVQIAAFDPKTVKSKFEANK